MSEAVVCGWCGTRPAVTVYEHADPEAFGTTNGPRCSECIPRNEYVGHDWRSNPVMRPVQPEQLHSIVTH